MVPSATEDSMQAMLGVGGMLEQYLI